VMQADLSRPGPWQDAVANARYAVMLQAQIGGEAYDEFVANNLTSTALILETSKRNGLAYLVHVSSSVVNSIASDFYTETKAEQEKMVAESGIAHCILRPTLMFGWFDRKHLGWLARFMKRSPLFPVPGSGRYMRQPLYVRDFCRIVLRCLEMQPAGEAYNITGRERIDYIDIIRTIKTASSARAAIVRVPYALFWSLLAAYALFDRNPPFTTKQLEALVTPDEFELIAWWDIFGVRATPFDQAIRETFHDERYANVVLQF
jgi:uncharacterized protein YbjT (DUF2867 family)